MTKPSVSFVSLGCPKNLVDSEKMLGLLAEAGCPLIGEGAQSDVRVINTCGFLGAARDEALEVIQEAAEAKRKGEIKRIIVVGCLVQRDGRGLIEQVPEIDALVGVNNRRDVVKAVLRHDAHDMADRTVWLGDYHPTSWKGANQSDRARLRLTPPHYAYLRVSEGCDQQCTFCTIPLIRGPMHSKPIEEILAEARELAEDGTVELNLIGQDTTSYGRDIGYEPGLAGLLRELNSLSGIAWIRLMYAYPSDFSNEMIEAVSDLDRVVKYIDLPLQHINDGILKAMHRRVTRKETESLLQKLRTRIPGVAIRTTFIAGFPGETDAAFEELLGFVKEFGFDAMGVFPYSNEPDTPAGRIKTQLPPDVIDARVEALMLAQQDIAFARAASRVGDRMCVLIDDYPQDAGSPARHQGQAPEVDSIVLVEDGGYGPGSFVTVRCTHSKDYDLVARAVDEADSGSPQCLAQQ
ncbi:MAG: 30S ribosomal protein S12 methylthiotransferase RimO [Planctomycetota bacterium]